MTWMNRFDPSRHYRTDSSKRSAHALCPAHFGALLILLCAPALTPGTVAETVLLTGATVHTVSGQTLTPGQVLIRGDRIVAVGSTVALPGARVIELDGLHLYPGLILPTSPMGLIEIAAVRATRDTTEVGDFTPDVQSWIAVNPDSELIPVARANGITHVVPVPSGGRVAGQSALLTLSGWTYEEMLVRAPVALHLFWPSMRIDPTPRSAAPDRATWKSPDEQARERRARIEELDDFFAEARAYAKGRAAGNQALDPSWDAMLPFLAGDLPILVHADDVRQIEAAVAWAERNECRIVLAGGRDAWRVADLLARHDVPVIFEHTFTLPTRDTDAYNAQFRAAAVLRNAGVLLAFSEGLGRFASSSARNLPYSAAQAVAFGLPESDAIQALTLNPARILGVADRLGSIEPGKEATLFAADGSILDIRSQVHRMWIAGREIDLETRHTRLYDRYRSRPSPHAP
jgi:imidazolonepropionase-like amidohydrolase